MVASILIESSQVPFSTAAALHIQHGPGWLADVWKLAFSSVGDVLVKFSNNRKRQHISDCQTLLENKR